MKYKKHGKNIIYLDVSNVFYFKYLKEFQEEESKIYISKRKCFVIYISILYTRVEHSKSIQTQRAHQSEQLAVRLSKYFNPDIQLYNLRLFRLKNFRFPSPKNWKEIMKRIQYFRSLCLQTKRESFTTYLLIYDFPLCPQKGSEAILTLEPIVIVTFMVCTLNTFCSLCIACIVYTRIKRGNKYPRRVALKTIFFYLDSYYYDHTLKDK